MVDDVRVDEVTVTDLDGDTVEGYAVYVVNPYSRFRMLNWFVSQLPERFRPDNVERIITVTRDEADRLSEAWLELYRGMPTMDDAFEGLNKLREYQET